MTRHIALTTLFLALAACGKPDAPATEDVPPPAPVVSIDDLARQYVILELAMGEIDPNHVDAYYGPDELRNEARESGLPADAIRDEAATLKAELATRLAAADGTLADRIRNLIARLDAMEMRLRINAGDVAPFDDESSALFMSVAPTYDAAHFDAILEQIDALVPGEGDLSGRVNAFREQFVLPVEKLPAVFEAAIEECRRRTLEHIELPAGESFTIEYVTDKPWSGYNWYQGNSHSLIQVNTELPIFIDRAVDLGCHEGYPGHHTWNALLEKNLVDEAGWIEFTVQPLFAPGAIIAEGSGNYGIDLAFPGADRIAFETEVLFPLAGLETGPAVAYYELMELLGQLNYAGNEAARGYLNGDIDAEAASDWLVKYSLNTPERAAQRIRFFDTYRSYVINYNHGKDQVKHYVEAGDADVDERWERFEKILSGPFLPDML
jgi:hypothetical protein